MPNKEVRQYSGDSTNTIAPDEVTECPGNASCGKLMNRVYTVMMHTARYAFQGQARLAHDVGCSRSTISRLVNGRTRPSLALAQAVTAALEKRLKRPLDLREVFSPDGTYPTPSGCALCGCRGCMPEEAYDGRGALKPAFRNFRPGDWSLSPGQHTESPPADESGIRKEAR